MGRLLWAGTEKDVPVRASWVIWSGAEPSFKRRTVPVAVCPTETLPKATASWDATRDPIAFPVATYPPQPDRPVRRRQSRATDGALRHGENRRAAGDAVWVIKPLSVGAAAFAHLLIPANKRTLDPREKLPKFLADCN